jgi:hypothetical protein
VNTSFKLFLSATLALSALSAATAATTSIRIQGRLTDNNGAPIVTDGPSGRMQVLLYPVATAGASVWDTGGEIPVETNAAGLFAQDIGPIDTSIFAANPTLYLELRVRSAAGLKTLSPRQKLATVPFASRADSAGSADSALTVPNNSIGGDQIKPESITNAHLAAGAANSVTIQDASVQVVDLAPEVIALTIPSGMIAMFAHACPTGWTRFTDLDNRFPLGTANYTGTGGGSNVISGLTTEAAGDHSHTVNAHTHAAGTLTTSQPNGLETDYKSGGGAWAGNAFHTHTISGATGPSSPGTDTQGRHTHVITSDGSWLPPYLGITFCEKN